MIFNINNLNVKKHILPFLFLLLYLLLHVIIMDGSFSTPLKRERNKRFISCLNISAVNELCPLNLLHSPVYLFADLNHVSFDDSLCLSAQDPVLTSSSTSWKEKSKKCKTGMFSCVLEQTSAVGVTMLRSFNSDLAEYFCAQSLR